MRADYELIAQEHLEGYGSYSHHLDAYEDFYSDDLHFLYELIQNAQDAIGGDVSKTSKRRMLHLVLRDHELLAYNDGAPFTEQHVRAICSIRQSTKDLTQVGTHGIGFKATGKFTDLPEIYSGEERFRIRRKVIPEAVDAVPDEIAVLVDRGLTVFRLPFRADLRAGSIDALAERLRHIHRWSLLFLHDLRRVEWSDEREGSSRAHGYYERDALAHPEVKGAKLVTLRSSVDGGNGAQTEEQHFLCFSREHSPPAWVVEDLRTRARDPRERERIAGSRSHPQPVEIAFALDAGGRIAPLADGTSVLFSFLPTGKESGLRFLIQAHFKTTFARDNIRDATEFSWNRWLLAEAAALVPDALSALERAGMLTPAVIRALPIPREDVPDGEGKPRILHPILAACVAALREHTLVPTEQEALCSVAEQVYHPHNRELRRLLHSRELAEVTGTGGAAWLHPDLRWGEDDEGDLLRAAGVREVRPSQVVDWLASKEATWFEDRADEWIAALYRYLASPALRSERERLKALPLVRLEDGTHVCARAPERAAFFPPAGEDEARLVAPLLSLLPFLRSSLLPSGSEAGGENVRSLLGEIGVRPLNLLGLLRDWLLPQYRGDDRAIFTPDENRAHVRFLVESLSRLPQSEATELSKAARDVPFLLCRTVSDGEDEPLVLKTPSEAYLPAAYTKSDDLETYFRAAQDAPIGDTGDEPVTAWFVDGDYLASATGDGRVHGQADWLKALTGFGAATAPRLQRIPDATLTEPFKEKLRERHGHTHDVSIEDYTLHGLDAVLLRLRDDSEGVQEGTEAVPPVLPLALWRLLVKSLRLFGGSFREQTFFALGVYRWSYQGSERSKQFVSSLDSKLRNAKWVLCEDGQCRAPHELYLPNEETRLILGGRAFFPHPDLGLREGQSDFRPATERTLAQTLRIRATVDINAALEHLEFLSGLGADEAPNAEEVADVYAALQRRNVQGQQEHRDAFKKKPLLFTTTPVPRWWTAGEAFWKDEESAFGEARGYLEAHYPTTLKPFFAAIGVAESASLSDYAHALLALAEQGDPGNEAVRARAHTLYGRIWAKLSAPENSGSSGQTASAPQEQPSSAAEAREAWRRLLGARCWLGCMGAGHWGWHERSALFLNDHDHNTALFADHLPFWTLPDLNAFAHFAELTAASQAHIDFRPLDGQEGGQEERPDWSERVRALADHIADFLSSPRLVGEEFPHKPLDFLASLRVVLVKRAEVTYTLGGVTVLDPKPLTSHLHVIEDGGEAILWAAADAEGAGELPDVIGDALAVHLGAWQLSGFVSRLLSSGDTERVLAYWQKLGLRYGQWESSQESVASFAALYSETASAGSNDPAPLSSDALAPVAEDEPFLTTAAVHDLSLESSPAGGDARLTYPAIPSLNDTPTTNLRNAVPVSGTTVHPAPSPAEVTEITQSLPGVGDIGIGGSAKFLYPALGGRLTYGSGGTRIAGSGGGNSGRSRYGFVGGEGETHRALKAMVRDNPALVGAGLTFIKEEYNIASGLAGSEVDVLLRDEKGRPVGVECKPSIAAGDYAPVWQAIRYKHLLAVEDGISCEAVRAVLVAPYFPPDVLAKCSLMGIECREIRPRKLQT